METVKERFLRYVAVDTQSKDDVENIPSTQKQFDLANMLKDELIQIGADDVMVSDHCYVTATIPANTDKKMPVIGLISHLDTSEEASGKNVHPIITENYDGNSISMSNGRELSPDEFPDLLKYRGKTIICTDGTTLLGADDKAGVAEIMTLAEKLLSDKSISHGKIRIAFTPDEEVGKGVDAFDVEGFDADMAFTVDGGELGELNYESFNAASADIEIDGFSIHTGSARGKMKNAALMAMELHSLLPAFMNPACTSDREGFFHLGNIKGCVEKAEMKYLIRDHDKALFEKKKEMMQNACDYMNKKYGTGTVCLKIEDSYYNMADAMDMDVVSRAVKAMRKAGVEPDIQPIRGGTDGSRLTFMGLPCPNICTGGHNFHGPYEYICLESMQKTVEILENIVCEG